METGPEGLAKNIYLAQLSACTSSCNCDACKLLREGAKEMVKHGMNPMPVIPTKEGD